MQVGGTKRGENPTIPDEDGGEVYKGSGRCVLCSLMSGAAGRRSAAIDAGLALAWGAGAWYSISPVKEGPLSIRMER